ncbi:hypothetical protein B484DRAFT_393106 [Ochromonadaceae sp. CCMP2298]|nr:hypothetical protein B484DRAFT_393106 [Ochromonadaceae sp. CCMP2298]
MDQAFDLDQIDVAVRLALAVLDPVPSGTDEAAVQSLFTDELLLQVARMVVSHVGFSGESALVYEELLTESIVAFTGQPIDSSTSSLLGQVMKALLEPVLSYHADGVEEGDLLVDTDSVDLLDQIGEQGGEPGLRSGGSGNSKIMERLERIERMGRMDDSSSGDEQDSRLMSSRERLYLSEEAEYADVDVDGVDDGDYVDGEAGDEVEEVSHEGSSTSVSLNSYDGGEEGEGVQTSDSSSDSEHMSFQSPAAHNVRRVVPETPATDPTQEPLPAWLMPKSPMDAYFRKGYGGLGEEELSEVIHEVTSSQKKAKQMSRIKDDNEMSSGTDTDSDAECAEEGSVESGYVEHQQLFASPTLDRKTHSRPADSPSDSDTPAWLMPKSPMDAYFRKGYGGLGKDDLKEVIHEVTSSQKKAKKEHEQMHMGEGGEGGEITLDDLPDDFGAGLVSATATPTSLKTRANGKGKGGATPTQALFQSPSGRGGAEVGAVPAWLMPKSPMDAYFRKGYGGLGKEELKEVIHEVTSSQKKAPRPPVSSPGVGKDTKDKLATKLLGNFHKAMPRPSDKSRPAPAPAPASPRGAKKKSGKRKPSVPYTSRTRLGARRDGETLKSAWGVGADDGGSDGAVENIMFEGGDADPDLLPSAHPSTGLPLDAAGSLQLTGSAVLNEMIRESYRGHMQQYASAPSHPSDPAPPLLQSPKIQTTLDEIDELIRTNLHKLSKIKKTTPHRGIGGIGGIGGKEPERRVQAQRQKLTRNKASFKKARTSNANANAKVAENGEPTPVVKTPLRRSSSTSRTSLPKNSRLLTPTVATSMRSVDLGAFSSDLLVQSQAARVSGVLSSLGEAKTLSQSKSLKVFDINSFNGQHVMRSTSASRSRAHTASSETPAARSSGQKASEGNKADKSSLAAGSRLTAPTFASVMRSLDTATNSPALRRMCSQGIGPSGGKVYSYKGSSLAKALLNSTDKAPRKRRKRRGKKGTAPITVMKSL